MEKSKNYKTELTLSFIVKLLLKKERNIAELSRELNIKRSSLIHYLNLLELRGFIERKRIEEKVTGRPTIIKLTKEKKREYEKLFTETSNFNIKVLKHISKNPIRKDTIEKFKGERGFVSKIISSLMALENQGLINNYDKLTLEGKKFLKENKTH